MALPYQKNFLHAQKLALVNIRPFDVAEPCPLDRDAGVPLSGRISDLAPDMLAFAVTIGPDD